MKVMLGQTVALIRTGKYSFNFICHVVCLVTFIRCLNHLLFLKFSFLMRISKQIPADGSAGGCRSQQIHLPLSACQSKRAGVSWARHGQGGSVRMPGAGGSFQMSDSGKCRHSKEVRMQFWLIKTSYKLYLIKAKSKRSVTVLHLG